MDLLIQYGGAIVAFVVAALALFLNAEHKKRITAELKAENVALKIEDAKLEAAADQILEQHREVLQELAKIEEAEKVLAKTELAPADVESYWNKKK